MCYRHLCKPYSNGVVVWVVICTEYCGEHKAIRHGMRTSAECQVHKMSRRSVIIPRDYVNLVCGLYCFVRYPTMSPYIS
jgi:hypothetical protein